MQKLQDGVLTERLWNKGKHFHLGVNWLSSSCGVGCVAATLAFQTSLSSKHWIRSRICVRHLGIPALPLGHQVRMTWMAARGG